MERKNQLFKRTNISYDLGSPGREAFPGQPAMPERIVFEESCVCRPIPTIRVTPAQPTQAVDGRFNQADSRFNDPWRNQTAATHHDQPFGGSRALSNGANSSGNTNNSSDNRKIGVVYIPPTKPGERGAYVPNVPVGTGISSNAIDWYRVEGEI